MFALRLATATLRGFGALVRTGCLFFAAGLLLQGVAQLGVEGLAKQPETAGQAWTRVKFAALLVAGGLGGELVRVVGKVLSERLREPARASWRREAFAAAVFWLGACLFLCLLILAGSLQTRWPVAGAYYWAAGAAGTLAAGLVVAIQPSIERQDESDGPVAGRHQSG
jgi:hypothetical protein